MYRGFQWAMRLVLTLSITIASFAHLGCASGGYQLTRKYARFVNKQNIIIRVVLYIFTAFVFAITLLVDAVIFNTLDFWNGRVSASNYEFEQDGKTFLVQHSYKGDNNKLRNTKIEIFKTELYSVGAVEKTIEISELPTGEVELREDGVLKKTFDSADHLKLSAKAEKKYIQPLNQRPVAMR